MPEATQSALRAVFAGIGRILSVADKVRNKPIPDAAPANGTATAAPETVAPETVAPEEAAPEAATPETAAPETVAPETVAPETVAPETVAPETVAPETVAPETVAPETETVAPEPETAEAEAAPEAAAPEAAAEPKAEAPQAEAGEAADLPLPNYAELTIASVRARLRNLSVEQLSTLVEYEKAHAARQDFISMFERRIAKVESGK